MTRQAGARPQTTCLVYGCKARNDLEALTVAFDREPYGRVCSSHGRVLGNWSDRGHWLIDFRRTDGWRLVSYLTPSRPERVALFPPDVAVPEARLHQEREYDRVGEASAVRPFGAAESPVDAQRDVDDWMH